MHELFRVIADRFEAVENAILEMREEIKKMQPTPQDDPEQLISKKKAAALLGCSQSSIDNYRRRKELKSVKIGKSVRFKRKDLLEFAQTKQG